MTKFKALIVEEKKDGIFSRSVGEQGIDDLPGNEVLIRVQFSSLNYKDALSASGNRGVTKKYPHTPGIDASGIVEEDRSGTYKKGQEVLVTGFDLGMNTPGGFGQYIRVPAKWVVPLPNGLSLQESMMYGTAGFTAALSVDRLEKEGIGPDSGDILVTGATGGVGSFAIGILARSGYSVTASTGKMHEQKFLMFLGAHNVINRSEMDDNSNSPLLKSRWTGVVDTVGGNTLSTAIRSAAGHGVVISCGNVMDYRFDCNVYPFILRGITLAGIDSAQYPAESRGAIWKRIASEWKLSQLSSMTRTVALDQLDKEIEKILLGNQVGRVVVDMR